MNFRFELRPIHDIAPWRTKDGAPSLSWFGLTDGWFWIEVDGQELFCYSQVLLDHWMRQYPDAPQSYLPYTDYPVVRYWEDLLDLLPTVLDPLPDDFTARVADWQSQYQWLEWAERARAWQETQENEAAWDTYYAATAWWEQRRWDAAHIQNPPRIWLWRFGDVVHIRWDNRSIKVDDLPVWAAEQGEVTLRIAEFREDVESFHARFLSAMKQRVADARQFWSRPDVTIDLDHLEWEQRERASWLEPNLRVVRQIIPWDEVRTAIATVEAALGQEDAEVDCPLRAG